MVFRDLNHSLGCSPFGYRVYPGTPSPEFYDVETFGVGQETEGFLPLNPQSVSLPLQLSHPRLDYGQLWQESAITQLDWLFTPSHKLQERLSTVPLQASTRFYPRFTLLTASSLGFGSYPHDSRHFHTSPLACCGKLVSLWLPIEWLTSPYRYTPWHVILNERHNP